MTTLNPRFDTAAAIASLPASTRASSLVDHLAESREPCPDCGYRLDGLRADHCPECGLALEASMFIGAGRVIENARLGVAWGLARLPFLAAGWSLSWAALIATARLARPAPVAIGPNPIHRLAAAGELYGVTLHAILGIAYLTLGLTLWLTRRDWSRDRTWRLWLLAACVLAFVHAPSFIPYFAG